MTQSNHQGTIIQNESFSVLLRLNDSTLPTIQEVFYQQSAQHWGTEFTWQANHSAPYGPTNHCAQLSVLKSSKRALDVVP